MARIFLALYIAMAWKKNVGVHHIFSLKDGQFGAAAAE
jgi:hypothetical protein